MTILLDTIVKWATTKPDGIALVGMNEADQQIQLTYSELKNKMESVATELIAQDIKALALRSENSLNWAIIDLAAMTANIVVVPIPTFFSDAQVEHTIIESGVDALIGDWQKLSVSSHVELRASIEANTTIAGQSLWRRKSVGQQHYLKGTGKITFTSGSTGRPKGVCLSNDHLCLVANSLAHRINHLAQSHLVLLPLSTLLENITGIYVPLILGVTSYIFPGRYTGLQGSSQFKPNLFSEILASVKPESLVLTPGLLLALIQLVKQTPSLAESLKFVAVGGARVSAQLIDSAYALNIPAYEGYGLSECGSVVCLNTPSDSRSGTCGKPLPHTQIRIAEDGELLVKGNVALGYLNDPFTQEWLATGDLAQIDEQGYVTLSGRKKNLIVTAFGRNVSPEWVESEAMILMPNVPFIITGNDQHALCAVIENNNNVEHKVSALNDRLPDYAQMQTLFMLEKPLAISSWYTENGKIKRNEIEVCVAQWLQDTTSELMLEGQKIERINVTSQHIIAY
ncbi:AMP-binding protein [Vibrio sp. RC27]